MNLIQQIVGYIIRPTREKYHLNRLGDREFDISSSQKHSINVVRYDGQTLNPKKHKIFYSVFVNSAALISDACVVYLHSNNGSRIQGMHYLNSLIQAKFNVCLLDFSGSGNSDGDYVSLGHNEAIDLESVVTELRLKFGIKKLIVWGRSMGACAGLIYASRYPNLIMGLILDSPFKDLRKLIKQIAC